MQKKTEHEQPSSTPKPQPKPVPGTGSDQTPAELNSEDNGSPTTSNLNVS